jgi:hypothetical protein
MRKRFQETLMTIRMLTTGAVLGAIGLCGCATTTGTPSKSAAASANCTESVAGRTLPENPCTTPGERSYSQTDLQNTGKTTVGGALPLLDPALTVRH